MPDTPHLLKQRDCWIFDLDNTLYPASCQLFQQVGKRITAFVANHLDLDDDEARHIQKKYFHDHGTTLRGMMIHHGVEPDEFLRFVHDIDYSVIPANPSLGAAINRLSGRKLIYTNASHAHAKSVLDRLQLGVDFEAIFDVKDGDYIPKPDPVPCQKLIDRYQINPERAVMVDDIPHNLKAPANFGMATILIDTGLDYPPDHPLAIDRNAAYIHHITDDLELFLEGLGL